MKKKGLIILGIIFIIIAVSVLINMNANKEQYKTRALKKTYNRPERVRLRYC